MKTKPLELLLEPLDNTRLANLCGVLDENLRQLETAYDVEIARRGENFRVSGDPVQSQRAVVALRHFYSVAKDHLSVDAIQLGLIELSNRGLPEPGAPRC